MTEKEFWERKWRQGHAERRTGKWRQKPGLWFAGDKGQDRGRKRSRLWGWLRIVFMAVFLVFVILAMAMEDAWAASGRAADYGKEQQNEACLAAASMEAAGTRGEEIYGTEGPEKIFGLDDFDFSDINQFIQKEDQGSALTMESVMGSLAEGNLGGLCREIMSALKQSLFSEISVGSRLIGQVLALGFVGAVFTNFSSVFRGSEISETGFFITYLLLFTFLAASLTESMAVTAEVVDDILEFMRLLMPSYFLAVAFAGGSVSAVVMYEFTLWVMAAGQWLLGNMILPVVKIYVLLGMAGNLVKEEFLSRLTELLGQAAGWGLKTLPGLVLGFHLVQGLILPYVDSLKQGTVQKAVSMIPGIGQGASAVTKLLVGSGVLIKNTIGAAAMVILMVLIAMPVLKLVILLVMYHCVAAVMEPVCDRRLVNCVTAAAKGQKMMVQVVMAAALILIITVAVVCAGTNVTYYA